jgi:hypothetical protein
MAIASPSNPNPLTALQAAQHGSKVERVPLDGEAAWLFTEYDDRLVSSKLFRATL